MGHRRKRKSILLGQNFLKDPRLVRELVDAAKIGPTDTVIEIGPGRGIITAELARRARLVVAVEKDGSLVRGLRERFGGTRKVRVVERDFLDFGVDASTGYKIFASIPFGSTARIMRKILYEAPLPREAFLILQREPARKYAGIPHETEASLLAKPIFEFAIMRTLRKTDFEPVPAVDSVLLRICRRPRPLLASGDYASYREFVRFGFGRWKPSVRLAFKNVFTYNQWKRLARELRFPLNATPTELTFEQWLGLFAARIGRAPRPRSDGGTKLRRNCSPVGP